MVIMLLDDSTILVYLKALIWLKVKPIPFDLITALVVSSPVELLLTLLSPKCREFSN